MAAKEGVDLFDRAGSDGENTTPEGNASRTHGKGFHQCVSMLLQTTLQVFTVAVRVLSGKASLYGVAEHLRQVKYVHSLAFIPVRELLVLSRAHTSVSNTM